MSSRMIMLSGDLEEVVSGCDSQIRLIKSVNQVLRATADLPRRCSSAAARLRARRDPSRLRFTGRPSRLRFGGDVRDSDLRDDGDDGLLGDDRDDGDDGGAGTTWTTGTTGARGRRGRRVIRFWMNTELLAVLCVILNPLSNRDRISPVALKLAADSANGGAKTLTGSDERMAVVHPKPQGSFEGNNRGYCLLLGSQKTLDAPSISFIFISNVGEKRRNFPFRVIGATNRSELRVGVDGVKKRGSRVEALPFAAGIRLIGNSVEKRIGHDLGNGPAAARGDYYKS
nr:uncharacterized protein LOC105950329 [Ipomoea trifida]